MIYGLEGKGGRRDPISLSCNRQSSWSVLRALSSHQGKVLNAARMGVVEERMGRAFSRKERLELNREGEEVSQVKKGDHKEVKRKH